MLKKNKSGSAEELEKLAQDYERLKKQLRALGYVIPGTIQKREYRCGKLNCRCVTEGILHGPYYQWTRKIRGKTVNLNLDPEVAPLLKEWILNNRKLRKLCHRLEKTSLAVVKISTNMEKA